MVVVDVNGDGAMIEVDTFGCDSGGRLWPDDSTGAGELVWESDELGVLRAIGRGQPGPIAMDVAGEQLSVTVNGTGWWARVRPA